MTRSFFLKFAGLTGLAGMLSGFKSSGPVNRFDRFKELENAGKNQTVKKALFLTRKLGLNPNNYKHY